MGEYGHWEETLEDQRSLLKSSGPHSPEACRRQPGTHNRVLIGGTQRVKRGGTVGAVVPGNLCVERMQRETCACRLMLASSPHCPATPIHPQAGMTKEGSCVMWLPDPSFMTLWPVLRHRLWKGIDQKARRSRSTLHTEEPFIRTFQV